MAGMAQGGRGRRLLGIAIIVVPWLLRDTIAVGLESASTASQAIKVALDDEEARQIQEREERRTLSRLVMLEHKVDKVEITLEDDPTFDKEVLSEGEDLKKSVAGFIKHVKDLEIDGDESAKVREAGESATAAAGQLKEYANSETPDAQKDSILAHFDSAGQHFFNEIKALSAKETEDAETYSTLATLSRIGAWILTAIGAVMLGGWKALMRDFVEEKVTEKADDA